MLRHSNNGRSSGNRSSKNIDTQSEVRSIVGQQPEQKRIPVGNLTIYREVQRIPPTKKLVKDIADVLNIAALGAFHVSLRPDGSMSLIDGQRRKAALEMRGMGTYKVNCLVYSGLTVAQEAALFRLLNRHRLVGKFDDFEKGVTSEDPMDVGITKALARHQIIVNRTSAPGKCSCVKSLREVWSRDGVGALLDRSVRVLNTAFGRDKGTLAGSLVEGAAAVLSSGQIDDDDVLIEKLRARYSTPGALVNAARARGEVEGGSLSKNVVTLIERAYLSRKKAIR